MFSCLISNPLEWSPTFHRYDTARWIHRSVGNVYYFFFSVRRYWACHMYDYSERVRILLTVYNEESLRTRIQCIHGGLYERITRSLKWFSFVSQLYYVRSVCSIHVDTSSMIVCIVYETKSNRIVRFRCFFEKALREISYLIFNNGRSALTKYNPFVYQIYNR